MTTKPLQTKPLTISYAPRVPRIVGSVLSVLLVAFGPAACGGNETNSSHKSQEKIQRIQSNQAKNDARVTPLIRAFRALPKPSAVPASQAPEIRAKRLEL